MTTANKKDSKIIILIAAAATVLRFLLCKGLMVYFVAGTHYDDIMQISKAFSIADGNWLGQYGSMTLKKGVGSHFAFFKSALSGRIPLPVYHRQHNIRMGNLSACKKQIFMPYGISYGFI